jgi:hypothetical protein
LAEPEKPDVSVTFRSDSAFNIWDFAVNEKLMSKSTTKYFILIFNNWLTPLKIMKRFK